MFWNKLRTLSIVNIIRSSAKPSMLPVMMQKLWLRIFGGSGAKPTAAGVAWLEEHRESVATFASSIDPQLWDESLRYAENFEREATAVLSAVPADLGGGGCYPFLHFLVRSLKPACVLETGVAAGYSSHAILQALQANGSGRLFSSDFPYFRIPDAEKYIGILVPQALRRDWSLYLDGDRENIPKILQQIDRIDLLHYDSDKSVQGREFVLKATSPFLHPRSVVLVDDVHNNAHFQEYVAGMDRDRWHVFEFEGKYLGAVIGSTLAREWSGS